MSQDVIFDAEGNPRIVTERADIVIPIERKVDGKIQYSETGYSAIRTRPATAEEINRWRFGA